MRAEDLPPRNRLRAQLISSHLGTDGVFLAARHVWWRHLPPLWGSAAVVVTIDAGVVSAHRCTHSHAALGGHIVAAPADEVTLSTRLGGHRAVLRFPSDDEVAIDGRAGVVELRSALDRP